MIIDDDGEQVMEWQQDGRALLVTRHEDSVETHAFHVRHVQGNVYEFDPRGDAR